MSTVAAESFTSYNMLLTSAGPTTDAMREHMLSFARQARAGAAIQVLRLADGWLPFSAQDEVSPGARIVHRVESLTARLWSDRYLSYVFGNRAVVTTVRLGQATADQAATWLEQADFLLVPGGNTYQTRRGIGDKATLLQQAVRRGLPYVGDSAGSILAGLTLDPAALAPADTRPPGMQENAGLGLLHADIVVHAPGRTDRFDISGLQARLAEAAFRASQTSAAVVEDFVAERGREVYTLHDARAVLVEGGRIGYV